EELYDMINDPYQLNNLIENEQYSRILKNMRKKLEKWKDDTNDSVPENPEPDRGTRWNEKKTS
ncbi:MAG: DUF4976 domain-containing protein, partial [Bacteroidales bacterium]|nr:DUF4976 domain-containing protein [Bacteroidales bacterium]